MKRSIFITLLINLSIGNIDPIVIDVNRTDQLNVSELAEKVIVVPLKINNFKNLGIVKVYLIDENLYMLQKYKEDDIPYSHVFRFDISGNYKGELVANDPVSNEQLKINDMHYDEVNKRIFLSSSDGYRVFDYEGKLLSYKARVQGKFIFKEQFWSVDYSSKNGIADYSLVHTDLIGQNKDTIKTIKMELPSSLANTGVGIFAPLSFSIHNNELYMSFGFDNTVYKVNKNFINPAYSFEFKNRPSSSIDKIIRAPNQILIGKYIQNHYYYNSIEYDYLYDTESYKSYNIKYLLDKNMDYISGIKDDYFNTGYFKFNPTNREDYIYFFKKPEELKKSKLNNPIQQNPIVFLIKLK